MTTPSSPPPRPPFDTSLAGLITILLTLLIGGPVISNIASDVCQNLMQWLRITYADEWNQTTGWGSAVWSDFVTWIYANALLASAVPTLIAFIALTYIFRVHIIRFINQTIGIPQGWRLAVATLLASGVLVVGLGLTNLLLLDEIAQAQTTLPTQISTNNPISETETETTPAGHLSVSPPTVSHNPTSSTDPTQDSSFTSGNNYGISPACTQTYISRGQTYTVQAGDTFYCVINRAGYRAYKSGEVNEVELFLQCNLPSLRERYEASPERMQLTIGEQIMIPPC